LCVGKAKAPKCSATSVTVANKGTFSVDPATAKVTFTPVSGFTGTVPAVGYQAADIFGQVASSTLSVTVSA
jgi:CshA-type fibril repeat protein